MNGVHIVMIRVMTIEDYDQVYALWKKIKGFGIRSIDDSREGVERFLKRNPSTSVVAEEDGKIVGAVCTTSVWMKRTEDMESEERWLFLP